MPPRHTYWTILFGDKPTAFRAATQEELLPTFGQIKARHPDAVMMWFARGKLWRSEEEGRAAFDRRRESPPFGQRDRPRDDNRPPDDRRPRAEWRDKPRRDFRGPRPPGAPKPRSGEGGEWRDKPRDDNRPRDERSPRPEWQNRDRAKTGDRPARDFRGPQPDWRDKPKPPWRDKPRDDDRPRDERPPRPEWQNRDRPKTGDRPARDVRGPKPDWRDKPKPPWRDKPRDDSRGPKPPEADGERRGRDWRPGGEHKDPRDRFKVPRDVKRARFKAQARRDRTTPRPPFKKKKDEE